MVLMDVDGPAGAGLDAEGTQMCRGKGVNVPIVGVQGVSVGDVFGGDGEDSGAWRRLLVVGPHS